MRFSTGLVVGKFCPLHQGHQLLIESAVGDCDQVIVISYTKPEFDRCGRANRERWIAELFSMVVPLVVDDEKLQALCRAKGIAGRAIPDNAAPEDEHREFVAWLCHVVLETRVDAVFTSEDYGVAVGDLVDARAPAGARPTRLHRPRSDSGSDQRQPYSTQSLRATALSRA